MKIKKFSLLFLLLITTSASAVKQKRLNRTNQLITEIKRGTVRTKLCVQESIDYHEKTLRKRLPKQQ